MSAIELRERVLIRVWQDEAAGNFSTVQTFDAGSGAWADITPVKAGIFYGAKQVGSDVTHSITLRRTVAVSELTMNPSKVIDHNGLRYRIKRSSRSRVEPRYIEVECECLGAI